MEGICYVPMTSVMVGDTMQFDFDAHNVYKIATENNILRPVTLPMPPCWQKRDKEDNSTIS